MKKNGFKGRKFIILLLLTLLLMGVVAGFFTKSNESQDIPQPQEKSLTEGRIVPIYKVDRDDKKISITLDGTWGAEHTEELLHIFEKHDIKVTFFFAGYWLEKYPEFVKKIAQQGHGIGNHTYSHPHCTQLSQAEIKKEINQTSELIEKLTGVIPQFFRAPYGEYNNEVMETVLELNYQPVQWSIDSLDWKNPGEEKIKNRVLENISSGDIVLMHNNASQTPGALRDIIPELKKRGFDIVPLSELIFSKNYIIQSHTGLQIPQDAEK